MSKNFVYSTQEELAEHLLRLEKEEIFSKMIGLNQSNLAFIKRLLKREPLNLAYTLEVIEEFLADYKEMGSILKETKVKEKENK